MTTPKRISITLTKEQREALEQVTGMRGEAIELTVDELEERIAPARTRGLPIDTVPLPD